MKSNRASGDEKYDACNATSGKAARASRSPPHEARVRERTPFATPTRHAELAQAWRHNGQARGRRDSEDASSQASGGSRRASRARSGLSRRPRDTEHRPQHRPLKPRTPFPASLLNPESGVSASLGERPAPRGGSASTSATRVSDARARPRDRWVPGGRAAGLRALVPACVSRGKCAGDARGHAIGRFPRGPEGVFCGPRHPSKHRRVAQVQAVNRKPLRSLTIA